MSAALTRRYTPEQETAVELDELWLPQYLAEQSRAQRLTVELQAIRERSRLIQAAHHATGAHKTAAARLVTVQLILDAENATQGDPDADFTVVIGYPPKGMTGSDWWCGLAKAVNQSPDVVSAALGQLVDAGVLVMTKVGKHHRGRWAGALAGATFNERLLTFIALDLPKPRPLGGSRSKRAIAPPTCPLCGSTDLIDFCRACGSVIEAQLDAESER
jgi:hypothetical protein